MDGWGLEMQRESGCRLQARGVDWIDLGIQKLDETKTPLGPRHFEL